MAQKNTKSKSSAIVAKESDGTIQITFTIPTKTVKEHETKALGELGKTIEVPGFRKGKAPVDKVAERVNPNALYDKILSGILPGMLADAIKDNKLTIALYPKFELVSAPVDGDWQVRATTTEFPKVKLGNYKEKLKAIKAKDAIWTPDKGDPKKTKDEKPGPTRAQKEQEAMKALLDSSDVTISGFLIREEADRKLSTLLDQLDKLGLTLDAHLKTIGKTPETLRAEYAQQARQTISIDLLLTEIAKEEGFKVSDKELAEVLASMKHEHDHTKEQEDQEKKYVESILLRRHALDYITSLV